MSVSYEAFIDVDNGRMMFCKHHAVWENAYQLLRNHNGYLGIRRKYISLCWNIGGVNIKNVQVAQYFLVNADDVFILHRQYNDCPCTGNARNQPWYQQPWYGTSLS